MTYYREIPILQPL